MIAVSIMHYRLSTSHPFDKFHPYIHFIYALPWRPFSRAHAGYLLETTHPLNKCICLPKVPWLFKTQAHTQTIVNSSILPIDASCTPFVQCIIRAPLCNTTYNGICRTFGHELHSHRQRHVLPSAATRKQPSDRPHENYSPTTIQEMVTNKNRTEGHGWLGRSSYYDSRNRIISSRIPIEDDISRQYRAIVVFYSICFSSDSFWITWKLMFKQRLIWFTEWFTRVIIWFVFNVPLLLLFRDDASSASFIKLSISLDPVNAL